MRRGGFKIAPALALVLLATGASAGSDAVGQSRADKIPAKVLLDRMSGTRNAYIAAAMQPFWRSTGQDLVLDRGDIERAKQRAGAVYRVTQLGKILKFDLDGDGKVTRREIDDTFRGDRKYTPDRAEKLFQSFAAYDINGDGAISIKEILTGSEQQKDTGNIRRSRSRTRLLDDMLALDPNGDGQLTGNELERLLRAAYTAFDRDGNGVFSAEEAKRLNKVKRGINKKIKEKQRIETCKLTEAATDAKVVLVGAYDSGSISTLSVAGPERLTATSVLEIEPGDTPLHIVAMSLRPMIWRLTGATTRVARFVAMATPLGKDKLPNVGVAGLPESRISFVSAKPCFRFFTEPKSGDARIAKAVVENKLQRPVEIVIAGYRLPGANIPSGKLAPNYAPNGGSMMFDLGAGNDIVVLGSKSNVLVKKNGDLFFGGRPLIANSPPPGIDGKTFGEFNFRFPGGVVKVDARGVVAPVPVETYEVLPQLAGIIQLMGEGRIERLSDGFFLIKKPIPRIPPGLAGGHSAKFLLGKGVPLPGGKIGRSCIVSEETGKMLGKGKNRC